MAWNRPKKGEATSRPLQRRSREYFPVIGAVAGAIVVVGTAVAWWTYSSDSGCHEVTSPTERSRVLIKESVPAVVKNPVHRETAASETKVEWREEYMKSTEMRLKFGKLFHVRTNDLGMVTERYRLPNGQTWRRVIDPPPIFENRCDQAIVMALGDASGASIPPVPGLDDSDLDAEFAKGDASPIEIKVDDKPEVAALKLAVREARAEIKAMIKNGDNRPIGVILQDHINLNNHIASMHTEALLQIEKVRKAEGDDFAADYRRKVNESFNQCGIPPLSEVEDDENEQGTNE